MATKAKPTKSADLKNWLDAKKRSTRILGDVERYLLTKEPEKRSTLVIHPSEVIKDDFCERESYFLLTGATPLRDRPNLRLQTIFDEGHEYHRKWQSRFEGMGVLWGKWDNGDGTPSWFGLPDDGPALNRRYLEVPVGNRTYRMSGHGDGVIRGIGPTAWLEVKSVGEGTMRVLAPELLRKAEQDANKAFRDISRPFADHLRQTLVYLELAAETYPDLSINEAIVIYEYKANQATHEFVVERNFDLVEPYFAKAARVVEAVKAGTPPVCKIPACKKHQRYEEKA